MANRKKTFTLQEAISLCLKSDNDESDTEIDSSDSYDDLVQDSTINLENMWNNIEENEPVLRNFVEEVQDPSTSRGPSSSSDDVAHDNEMDTVSKFPWNMLLGDIVIHKDGWG